MGRHVASAALGLVVALWAVPAAAGGVCEASRWFKSQCGGDGCYRAYQKGVAQPTTTWAETADRKSACCYDAAAHRCDLGAKSDKGPPKYLLCPKRDKGRRMRLVRCGLNCISRKAECTFEVSRCKENGYDKLCPGNFCGGPCGDDCGEQGKGFCGEQCFDERTERCVDGHKVCDLKSDSLCNTRCFDSKVGRCVDDKKVCDLKSDSLCNTRCFDSKTHHCADESTGTLCPLSEIFCGAKCVPGEGRHCPDGEHLCDKGEDGVCGGICFSSAKQTCFKESVLCPATAAGVCQGECFSGDWHVCISDKHLCDKPNNAWDLCADCYERRTKALGEACHRDQQCRKGKCLGSRRSGCQEGVCVCTRDSHCGATRFCDKRDKKQCVDRKGNGKSCGHDRHCRSGRCVGGECKSCEKDYHCPRGRRCRKGMCR